MRVFKRSPPAAFDLCFHPWESILLKLFDLGAYGGRSATVDKLQLSGREKQAIQVVAEESRDIEIPNGRILLTPEGVSEAFRKFDVYCKIRARTFADIRNSPLELDVRAVASMPECMPEIVQLTSIVRREALNIMHNNRVTI